MSYWLHAVHPSGSTSPIWVHMHYNIRTGELLVDGVALARLTIDYESNETCSILFGRSQLEVMPSDIFGMQFSCQYSGYTIHLGKIACPGSSDHDISVNASKDGQAWDFVLWRVFAGHFPGEFIDEYAPWFVTEKGFVEFRPLETPWTSSDRHWRLRKIGLQDT